MTLKPINDNLIVKAATPAEVTKSGIVLPESSKNEKPEKGEVVAVGPGKLLDNGTRVPLTVKVGDQIIFKKYGPDEIKIDDQEYLVLSESEVLAVIE